MTMAQIFDHEIKPYMEFRSWDEYSGMPAVNDYGKRQDKTIIDNNGNVYLSDGKDSYYRKNKYGDVFYVNDKFHCHRLDGPAFEWACGDKSWWVNGKRHRLDGPAIEYANGHKEWWVNGNFIKNE